MPAGGAHMNVIADGAASESYLMRDTNMFVRGRGVPSGSGVAEGLI